MDSAGLLCRFDLRLLLFRNAVSPRSDHGDVYSIETRTGEGGAGRHRKRIRAPSDGETGHRCNAERGYGSARQYEGAIRVGGKTQVKHAYKSDQEKTVGKFKRC